MYTPLDLFSLETWALLVAIVILIKLYIHQKWQVLKNMNIPHDPPSLRNFGTVGDLGKDFDNFFKNDVADMKRFGRIYGDYTLFKYNISIGDPEILKHIFIKEFSNFFDRQKSFNRLSGKEMNQSLFNSSGEKWKRIRSTLTPAFSTYKLKEMMGIIENCIDLTVNNLKKAAIDNKGRFSTQEVFGKLSLDVICSTAFSANVHSQDGDKDEDKEPKVVTMAKTFFSANFNNNPIFMFIMMFPWLETVLEKFNYTMFSKPSLTYFGALTDNLIRRGANVTSRSDLMQTMLKYQVTEARKQAGITKGLTRDEIVGNSMLMILAGYETTANTMLFLAYNLATHKEVQNKLREEIAEGIKKHGGLNYECVTTLKYLDMCMNESLRLYTPVAKNSRYCEEDITIKGLFIPKDTFVQIPVYGLAHDEEYWEKPFEFNPERMSDMDAIDPMTFTPFGAGPRNCIAMRFAQLEVKIAMCKLLMEFDLDVCDDTPPPPLEMTFGGSMKPKIPFDLKVIPKK